MGGCASRPKGMDLHPTASPTNNPEAETIPQEINNNNNNGGESAAAAAAAPLVDLSESKEPKQEATSKPTEPKPKPEPEPEPAGAVPDKSTIPDLTQAEKVEAIAKESEDKTSVDKGKTVTKDKTGDATPTSEDKSIASVVVAV